MIENNTSAREGGYYQEAKKYLLGIGFDDSHLPELFNDSDKSYYTIPELMQAYLESRLPSHNELHPDITHVQIDPNASPETIQTINGIVEHVLEKESLPRKDSLEILGYSFETGN